MGVVAGCDIVVATRFHNVVGALALGKPVISVGYAKKNDMLLAGLGLGDFCQHIESLDPDLLMRQFAALTAGRDGYAALVRLGVAGLRTELKVQEAELAMLFLQDAATATVPAQGAPAV
jgi:polysaccharide pyruvyl transferase WcaK-like protein